MIARVFSVVTISVLGTNETKRNHETRLYLEIFSQLHILAPILGMLTRISENKIIKIKKSSRHLAFVVISFPPEIEYSNLSRAIS